MRRTCCISIALFVALAATSLRADVKLPAIIGDHMVLQRDAKVPMWGWADPNETITITAGDIKVTVTAGADGKWMTTLQGLKASDQPNDVTIAGKNTLILHDVLIGDVWICSGQSNMEFPLNNAHNAQEEIPKAVQPTLRLFLVPHLIALDPQTDTTGKWEVCTPKTSPRFSAVGYFFARDIMQDQKVPVGMIGAYWGGTPAQSWMSSESLKAEPTLSGLATQAEQTKANLPELKQKFESEALPTWQKADATWHLQSTQYQNDLHAWTTDAAQAQAQGTPPPAKPAAMKPEPNKPVAPDSNPYAPTVLNNGMIAPILPFAIKGAIWYQGEANAATPKMYETMFPALIKDWRTRWGEGDFPFFWVQLANFYARTLDPVQDGWAGLRDAQTKTLKVPNTGQAVIIDIGQADNIHPKDKLAVGHRLALAARHVAYGEDIVYSGPTYDSMQVEDDKVRVRFKNTGSGLTIAAAPSTQPGVQPDPPAGELKGFAIAGDDKKFVWATAIIDGDSVIVSSPDVKAPKAVRYGWANNPAVNLYNKDGLPASPFRTDDWSNGHER